ncbi:MAG: bifunctional folylpolyglutamate synthase/dihydrofolate synthase [Chloroflexi bacterium]|nr:bifunctional folylpolyglutamate synthase/dihydrofolate synthase [Chloroflexota bacterium]
MDYQDAVTYVQGFTDYENIPGVHYTASTYDLSRVEQLLDKLGTPHLKARTAHIAGTKGKGSTTAMLASVLMASGLRTGMYTSPHFHTIRERIQVDGNMISEGDFAMAAGEIAPLMSQVNAQSAPYTLTTFEVLTALCFVHFARQRVQYQVLEVGLGGRLDATNVVRPDVCVITSISLDHTEVLGKTVEAIAAEKAGIIKPGTTVICARHLPAVEAVIEKACRDKGATLLRIGQDIRYAPGPFDHKGQSMLVDGSRGRYRLELELLGEHQMENAACALAAAEILSDRDPAITVEAIETGISATRWPGRLQVLGESPWLVCDGAHNADSAAKLGTALKRHFRYRRAIFIVGASADKDLDGIARELAPLAYRVIATRSAHPRSAAPEVLARAFGRCSVRAAQASSVGEALRQAKAEACPEDLICVTGSLFVVGEVLAAG